MFKTLRGKLIFSYILIVAASLLIASLLFIQLIRSYQTWVRPREITTNTKAVTEKVKNDLEAGIEPKDIAWIKNTGQNIKTNIVIVDKNRQVLADSTTDNQYVGEIFTSVEPAQFRPRISGTGIASGVRVFQNVYIDSIQEKATVAFEPIKQPKKPLLFVVLFSTQKTFGEGFFSFASLLIMAGIFALLISILVGWLFASRITKPLRQMTTSARKIARGDFSETVQARTGDEVEELGSAFNYMAAEVKRSRDAQRDFVANVSHELRTPLTSIQGFSQLLMENEEMGREQIAHYGKIINKESERLMRLIKDLLDLSRIESGKFVLHKEMINTVDFFQEIKEKFLPQAMEKRIEFELKIPEKLPQINADKSKLEQVILNLLANAITNTPEKGKITLVSSLWDGGNLKIEVIDTGAGISAEDLPRIFERFYRADKSRSGSGTGLGLPIAREIVRTHDGEIKVQSELGKGTNFTIVIPLGA